MQNRQLRASLENPFPKDIFLSRDSEFGWDERTAERCARDPEPEKGGRGKKSEARTAAENSGHRHPGRSAIGGTVIGTD
jgi:hypothetical protein